MGQGERIARGYIGAVLTVQALVAAHAAGYGEPRLMAAQLAAAALLWMPLVFDFERYPTQVRAVSAVPAVAIGMWWAVQSAPMGIVAWGAWALITAWLCFPGRRKGEATLAQRFAPGRAQTGVRHL